jgi:hypothetical protein
MNMQPEQFYTSQNYYDPGGGRKITKKDISWENF